MMPSPQPTMTAVRVPSSKVTTAIQVLPPERSMVPPSIVRGSWRSTDHELRSPSHWPSQALTSSRTSPQRSTVAQVTRPGG